MPPAVTPLPSSPACQLAPQWLTGSQITLGLAQITILPLFLRFPEPETSSPMNCVGREWFQSFCISFVLKSSFLYLKSVFLSENFLLKCIEKELDNEEGQNVQR